MGSSWTRRWKEELTVEKISLTLPRPELLLQPQWNIGPWPWLFYRVFMLIYTLSWCVYSGLLFSTPKWLILMSHLSYSVMGIYYLVAVCNLAGAFAVVRLFFQKEASCTGGSTIGHNCESSGPFPLPNVLAVSLCMQWFLHTVMSTFSVIVSFIYWTIEYPVVHHRLSPFNIDLHVINTAQVMLDLGLSSTPVHLAHYLYLLLISCLYLIFCVAYWLAGFTNLDGHPYVYKVLDFGERPLLATVCVLGFCLICLPFFHFLLWNAYLLRRLLAARAKGSRLALHRERWWWKVGGLNVSLPVPLLDLSTSVFAPKRTGITGDQAQTLLLRANCGYNATDTNH